MRKSLRYVFTTNLLLTFLTLEPSILTHTGTFSTELRQNIPFYSLQKTGFLFVSLPVINHSTATPVNCPSFTVRTYIRD